MVMYWTTRDTTRGQQYDRETNVGPIPTQGVCLRQPLDKLGTDSWVGCLVVYSLKSRWNQCQ